MKVVGVPTNVKFDNLYYFWQSSLMNISLTPELEKLVRERVE